MAFPIVTPEVVPQVTFVWGSALSATYDLLDFSGASMQYNVSPLKPYGSNVQNVKGDGTFRISPLRFTIRVPGPRRTAMAALLDQLKDVTSIEIGEDWLEIAGGVGVVSWAPLGYSDTRVVVELIPARMLWSSDAAAAVV